MADEFQIIRLGLGYGFALVQTPPLAPEAKRVPEGTRFWRWADWKIGPHEPFTWTEIDERGVMAYFSGHADGLGFEVLPEHHFASLDAVAAYLTENRARDQSSALDGDLHDDEQT